MLKLTLGCAALAGVVLLSACGKENNTTDKQANHRSTLGPELRSPWQTTCADKTIRRVIIDGDRMTFEKTTFLDPYCTEKERTVRHSGKAALAHNYKEGVDNSIVFQADGEITVTLFTDFEVDAQNNVLTRINNERETEMKAEWNIYEARKVRWENLKIREAKKLAQWKRDEDKAFTRPQFEKVKDYGLAAELVTEMGNRISFRYEVDNGFLHLSGPGEFGRVYGR